MFTVERLTITPIPRPMSFPFHRVSKVSELLRYSATLESHMGYFLFMSQRDLELLRRLSCWSVICCNKFPATPYTYNTAITKSTTVTVLICLLMRVHLMALLTFSRMQFPIARYCPLNNRSHLPSARSGSNNYTRGSENGSPLKRHPAFRRSASVIPTYHRKHQRTRLLEISIRVAE